MPKGGKKGEKKSRDIASGKCSNYAWYIYWKIISYASV